MPAGADEVQLRTGELVKGVIQSVDDTGIRIRIDGPDGTSQVRAIRTADYKFYSIDAAPNAPIPEESTIPIVEEGSGRYEYGQIVQVFSSVAYRFRSNNGHLSMIKLISVNPEGELAPGSGGKSFSALATESARQLLALENHQVRLEFDEARQESSGRLLVYMFIGEGDKPTMMNEKLLELGFARFVADERNTRYAERLQAAEEKAKASKAGLWPFDGLSEVDRLAAITRDPSIRIQNLDTFYNPYSGRATGASREGSAPALPDPVTVPVSPPIPPQPEPGSGTLAERLADQPGNVNLTPPRGNRNAAASTEAVNPPAAANPAPAPAAPALTAEVRELIDIIRQKDEMLQKKDEQLDRLINHLIAERAVPAAVPTEAPAPAAPTPAPPTPAPAAATPLDATPANASGE